MGNKRLIIIQDNELPPTFSFADEDKMFTLATIPFQDITTDLKKRIRAFNGKNRKRKLLTFGRLFMKKLDNGEYSTAPEHLKSVVMFETQEYKNIGETIQKHKELLEFFDMDSLKYFEVNDVKTLLECSEKQVILNGDVRFLPSSIFNIRK